MLRFLTFTAFLAGALLFIHGAAQAQDQDLPVAGPDEIIIVGEVPAPPGTDVWAFYFVSEFFSCGQATADENSRFVLVVDAGCATPLGPAICWGELPDWETGPEELCDGTLSPVGGGDPPDAGETVDMGLLRRTAVPGTPDAVPTQPLDGYPRFVDVPVAGPDEIIFIGEVPAVPGTQVWAIYLGEGFVSCGTTEANDTSHFVLVVDASCTSFLGPVICWGELPDWEDGQEEFCDGRRSSPLNVRPEAGDTVDVGMLLPRSEQPPSELDIGAPPHGDGILPAVGRSAAGSDGNHKGMWLAIGLLLAAALVAGVGSLALRRRGSRGL